MVYKKLLNTSLPHYGGIRVNTEVRRLLIDASVNSRNAAIKDSCQAHALRCQVSSWNLPRADERLLLAAILQMINTIDRRKHINQAIPMFKF